MDEPTTTPRRRRFSIEDKLRMLEEASLPGMTVSFVARRHCIAPSLIFQWRMRLANGGKGNARIGDASRVRALEARVVDLERVLGRSVLENEMLREAARAALDGHSDNPSTPGTESPRGNGS